MALLLAMLGISTIKLLARARHAVAAAAWSGRRIRIGCSRVRVTGACATRVGISSSCSRLLRGRRRSRAGRCGIGSGCTHRVRAAGRCTAASRTRGLS